MTNLPVTGNFKVTCEYGRKGTLWASGYHKGIDLTCSNLDIYCTCDGIVKTVGWDADGWGQYVRVQESTTKKIHIFCHMVKGSVKVAVGQEVNRSSILGTMGTTGNSTGVHLHFQIEDSKRNVYDPTEWLNIPNKVGSYDSKNYPIEEVKTMAYRDEESFPKWAKDEIAEVTKEGLMEGDPNGNFRPNDPVTRAELAVVLSRLK